MAVDGAASAPHGASAGLGIEAVQAESRNECGAVEPDHDPQPHMDVRGPGHHELPSSRQLCLSAQEFLAAPARVVHRWLAAQPAQAGGCNWASTANAVQ